MRGRRGPTRKREDTVTKDRLIACLLSIALGASVAFALPGSGDAGCSVRQPAPSIRIDSGRRKFNWRAFVEAMLPRAIRAKAAGAAPADDAVDSTDLVDRLGLLSRVARRATGRRS